METRYMPGTKIVSYHVIDGYKIFANMNTGMWNLRSPEGQEIARKVWTIEDARELIEQHRSSK